MLRMPSITYSSYLINKAIFAAELYFIEMGEFLNETEFHCDCHKLQNGEMERYESLFR